MHRAFLFMAFSVQISKCFKWLWWHTYEFMNVFFIMCSPLLLRGYADCFWLGWKRRARRSGWQIRNALQPFPTLSSGPSPKLAGTLYPGNDKNKWQIVLVLEYNCWFWFWRHNTYKKLWSISSYLHYQLVLKTRHRHLKWKESKAHRSIEGAGARQHPQELRTRSLRWRPDRIYFVRSNSGAV